MQVRGVRLQRRFDGSDSQVSPISKRVRSQLARSIWQVKETGVGYQVEMWLSKRSGTSAVGSLIDFDIEWATRSQSPRKKWRSVKSNLSPVRYKPQWRNAPP